MRILDAFLLATTLLATSKVHAFAPGTAFVRSVSPKCQQTSSITSLFAIGVLARKAKEANVRKYCEEGVEDSVMEQLKIIKDDARDSAVELGTGEPGPLQQLLTRRKGTITLIAEYKRKIDGAGYIEDVFDPEILSPTFREFGASGIAVMADERMGGCNYEDLAAFIEEQRRAVNEVPGPLMVINNDLIVDEIQIARTAAIGARGVVLTLNVIGEELTLELLKAAKAVDVEAVVAVSTKDEAQTAVNLGARILVVTNVEKAEDKSAVIEGLKIPEGQQVCTIANILARNNKQLEEIEEAWVCRDKGFNAVWVSDALYKAGADATEHPGAIIKGMLSKSSVRWASPKARSGKGEGAREYLGDILM